MERKIDSNIFLSSNQVGNRVDEVTDKVTEQIDSNEKQVISSDIFSQKPDSSVNVGNAPAISLKHIRQIFDEGTENEYRLFDDFNLDIPVVKHKSELISIVGGSGCGKSQLLRSIAGLSHPQGEIRIYGKTLQEYGSIPMVFQTYSNYEWMTVLDNIMLPMKIKGVPDKDARERAMELVKLVGLEEHATKYAKNSVLSGGQLQRVSIARSLACNSEVILLDEATGALDIKMKREVQNIILKIMANSERTILNVTHSIEEAVYLSTKIIVLQPKPCRVYETMDIHYDGEEDSPRGNWIFNTRKFVEYSNELTHYLEDVCK